ncbi:DNA-3-methyladenine glycosylase I [Motilibacter peucedani]|uniref:DNA-3-methyladenine glycosylase I n=1 Tax=Motilibacter peucedani TaxID=598650 RepID=A0A420XMC7_9ACTN|nr:DNA-3-methyladenine glycosylase I [Motilibacter peucedani]RKS72460.1 DNA-3-methyladenine glycosylase I [Motilibacter peucedani]
MAGLVLGDDGLLRCPWAGAGAGGDRLYLDYHDTEWGRPVHGERALLERITLEAFQSGLAWITILRKRPAFRAAFEDFEPEAVAAFDEARVERLLADAGIVRNRAKVEAAVANARATVALADAGESLDALVWSFAPPPRPRPATTDGIPATTPESTALAKALKARGFRFVGPTTAYAAMQACGLVDDHLEGCVAGR